MAKFKDGDIIVAKFKEEQPLDPLLSFDIVTDLQQGQYFLAYDGTVDVERAEEEFVRIEDVLWIHYILDTITNKLERFEKSMTIEQAKDLYAPKKSIDTFLLTAYWEGFKIPTKKEIEFIEGNILVRKSDAGRAIKDDVRYLPKVDVANLEEDIYYLSNGSVIDIKTAQEVYLDAFGSNVLWYWEFKTDGDWSMPTSTRKSFQDTLEMTSIDGKSVTERRILYSLGFSIKE